MADNRTTVKANIVAENVPSVTNTKLNTMLNTYLADNLVFGADVAVPQSSSVSNITVDFVGKDRVDLTRLGGSLNITPTGISDGEVKYLLITKTAGQSVSFVGVTDITPVDDLVTAATTVLYEIIRKSSNYYAEAFVDYQVNDIVSPSGWTTPTLGQGTHIVGNNIKYRLIMGNQLQIKGGFTSGGPSSVALFNLPADYRPLEDRYGRFGVNDFTTGLDFHSFCYVIQSSGNVYPANLPGVGAFPLGYDLFIDTIIPLT